MKCFVTIVLIVLTCVHLIVRLNVAAAQSSPLTIQRELVAKRQTTYSSVLDLIQFLLV